MAWPSTTLRGNWPKRGSRTPFRVRTYGSAAIVRIKYTLTDRQVDPHLGSNIDVSAECPLPLRF